MRATITFFCLLFAVLVLSACGTSAQANGLPTLNAAAPAVQNVAWQATPWPTEWSTPSFADRVSESGHTLGPDDAYLTIVMFGEFQCELCARYARDLEELRARYPDDIRLIWRHLPDMRNHDKASLALQASEAAAAQGAFWPMHDQLFTHLSEWINLTPAEFRPVLSQYAATVGLDVARFDAELDSAIYEPLVQSSLQDAADLEIMGSPMLLYNGIPYSGRDDLYGLDEGVKLALLEKRFFDHAPDITIDPYKTYRATIVTAKGNIVIDLFARDAPVTVNNFIFLAQNGWYNDITFHYVVPDFVAQTGDPSNTGRGGPGYTIPDEADNGLTFDREGLVAMAHPAGMANSAGSEFFITLAPLKPAYEWDGQYTIFGIVVEGMDVVRSLTPRNANDPIRYPDPPPGDQVLTVTIEES